MKISKPQTY